MATAAFIKQLQEENWDLKWENLRLKEEIRKLAGTDHAPRSNGACSPSPHERGRKRPNQGDVLDRPHDKPIRGEDRFGGWSGWRYVDTVFWTYRLLSHSSLLVYLLAQVFWTTSLLESARLSFYRSLLDYFLLKSTKLLFTQDYWTTFLLEFTRLPMLPSYSGLLA
jgi:hypothetical protein